MGILVSNAVSETEFFRIAQQTALKLGLKVDYEHEQMAHLGRALTDADRFLDIGANQGLYARVANCVLRNGSIALVEANPDLAEMLRRDIASWPDNGNRIEVFPVAAGDVATKLPFFMHGSDELGTLVQKNPQATQYAEVACEPLDTLFAPQARTLMKIDVEGFEYRVVLGARRLLSSGARVFLELHGWGDVERKKFPFHVIWQMYRQGFAVSRIGNSYTYDFVRAGFLKRTATFLRWGPVFAAKYLIRRLGLRPLVYRILWPDLAARAGN